MLTLKTLTKLRRCGSYREIARLANSLDPKSLPHEVALGMARADAFAGRVISSDRWLQYAAGEDSRSQLVVKLELAMLGILRNLDIDTALKTVDAVQKDVGTVDDTEINWLVLRLKLAAGIYGVISPAELKQTKNKLNNMARELRLAGLTSEAKWAEFQRAEAAGNPIDELQSLTEKLENWNNMNFTASALIRMCELALSDENITVDTIEAWLQQATDIYQQTNHLIGPIDVARVRAELVIRRLHGSLELLQDVAEQYLAAEFPKSAYSVLSTLEVEARRRGEMDIAKNTVEKIDALMETTGMKMGVKMRSYQAADTAMREGHYAEARDLCDAALALDMPVLLEAGLYALRGSALSFSGERKDAVQWLSRAVDTYVSSERDDSASDQICSLVSNMASSRQSDDIAAANALLSEWIERDKIRGAHLELGKKLLQRAEIIGLDIMGNRDRNTPFDEQKATAGAYKFIQEAERAIPQDSKTDASAFIGQIAQARGFIAGLQNDLVAARNAQVQALEQYEVTGSAFEAANTHHLIGCFDLNSVNAAEGTSWAVHADSAQGHFIRALEYYDSSGMRAMAAQTAHKLAMLYLNIHHRLAEKPAAEIADKAETLLNAAIDHIDVLRRAHSAKDRSQALSGKVNFGRISQEITQEAIRLFTIIKPDNNQAWHWISASKARALSDLLALDVHIPSALTERFQDSTQLENMVFEERQLSSQLAEAPRENRHAIGNSLNILREKMYAREELQSYLDLRTGAAASTDDLRMAFDGAPPNATFVDWFQISRDRLAILVVQADMKPQIEQLPISMDDVNRFVATELDTRNFRITLNEQPEQLQLLANLVAPIAWLTEPGDPLVLCPTGSLRSVPLHVLKIAGAPLLNRNPIAYSPSLSVLRHVRSRRSVINPQVSVFGQPTEGLARTDIVAEQIATLFKTTPITGKQATVENLAKSLATSSIVHVQTHGVQNTSDALSSHLVMAGHQKFTARQLFEQQVAAQIITLGACETAALVSKAGDEPLGLVPAFLQAGVRAVAAPMWQVRDTSAAFFMEEYYKQLLNGVASINALQNVTIAMQSSSEFSTPYHWGAFTITGDPWITIGEK